VGDKLPKLVYTETAKVCRRKPPDLFIESEGHHILSSTCTDDVCSILLYPDFIVDAAERESVFQTLLHTIPWEEKSVVINGKKVPMPRKVAWYGPIPYRFSGTILPAISQWPTVIQYLHDQILNATGHEFNSVLLNLYRNGKDSVAWHSNDELLMGVNPVIASLSFGETRMFELREKLADARAEDYDFVQHVKIPLKDGTLLIMQENTQTYWQHRIPKELHDRKARINLTFRTVFPKPTS